MIERMDYGVFCKMGDDSFMPIYDNKYSKNTTCDKIAVAFLQLNDGENVFQVYPLQPCHRLYTTLYFATKCILNVK